MVKTAHNRVREERDARGWSQTDLAEVVGLSRQSVHAIEAGKATPAVDVALRLAHALHCVVEDLFGGTLPAEPRTADGVVLMGCSPALGLLAQRLNARPGAGRFIWLTRSSGTALTALKQRHAQLAGVHLTDATTGEANVPDVRRLAAKRSLVVITLARWEAGLAVAPGNPRHVADVSALAEQGLRLATREPGSGARRLLEQKLRSSGLPLELARRAAVHAADHAEVARAVALGIADVGVATRDAALARGLGFIPLAEERYDVVVARDDIANPSLVRLFETMTAAPFRRELSAIGYDVSQCGKRVAEVRAV